MVEGTLTLVLPFQETTPYWSEAILLWHTCVRPRNARLGNQLFTRRPVVDTIYCTYPPRAGGYTEINRIWYKRAGNTFPPLLMKAKAPAGWSPWTTARLPVYST